MPAVSRVLFEWGVVQIVEVAVGVTVLVEEINDASSEDDLIPVLLDHGHTAQNPEQGHRRRRDRGEAQLLDAQTCGLHHRGGASAIQRPCG